MCARTAAGSHSPSEQHTLGHIDCPACEKARSVTLARIAPSLPFSSAAAIWLESRSFNAAPGAISARYIRESTERSYRAYVDSLNLFFCDLPLAKIHLGHLRQYQEARVTGAPPFIRYRRPQDAKPRLLPGGVVLPPKGKQPCPASAKKANQELSILKKILRRAQCWTDEMDEFYEPFMENATDVPKSLTVEQQQLWIDASRLQESWSVVHWYSLLAFDTGQGSNEMRWMRVGDINLHHEIVSVQPLGAKNHYRARTIPLVTADAKWAAEQLLRRAYDLGSRDPQHYVFPFCLGRRRGSWAEGPSLFDPCRSMTVSGLKRPWDEIRKATKLVDFTPYHTRHTALTRWAEGGMEIATLMDLAGHLTVRQMRHYARISDAVKRKAIRAARGQNPPKYGPASVPSVPFYQPKADKWG